ncbi:cytochrome c-type biogenesis protein [Bacillaceae bacterium IKA-2]|nr:cytochrome c-type biogenesis protein [Bacillaceae bacterium IKA-2]
MKKLIFIWTLLFMMIGIPVFANGEQYDYKSQEFKEVASQFMCMCGCGQDHFECNMQGCGLNDSFKIEIKEMMDDGLGKADIKDYYLSIYGEEILTAPEKRGFSLTAWVLPFIAIGGAGTGVFFALRRWIAVSSGLSETYNETTDEDDIQNEIVQSIIEEERKKYY